MNVYNLSDKGYKDTSIFVSRNEIVTVKFGTASKNGDVDIHISKNENKIDLFSFENTLICANPVFDVNIKEILDYVKSHTNFTKLYIVLSSEGTEREYMYLNTLYKCLISYMCVNNTKQFNKFRIYVSGITGDVVKPFNVNKYEKDNTIMLSKNEKRTISVKEIRTYGFEFPYAVIEYGRIPYKYKNIIPGIISFTS